MGSRMSVIESDTGKVAAKVEELELATQTMQLNDVNEDRIAAMEAKDKRALSNESGKSGKSRRRI